MLLWTSLVRHDGNRSLKTATHRAWIGLNVMHTPEEYDRMIFFPCLTIGPLFIDLLDNFLRPVPYDDYDFLNEMI